VIQALIQNSGDEIPFVQGTPVQVHFPVEALRVLIDTEASAPPIKGAAAKGAAA